MKRFYLKHFSLFLILMTFLSCQMEEGETKEQNFAPDSDITLSERPIPSEDMTNFRTLLSEAVIKGQNGDKQEYEEILMEASKAFLDFNNIPYQKTESKSDIFSKALSLYSEKTLKQKIKN